MTDIAPIWEYELDAEGNEVLVSRDPTSDEIAAVETRRSDALAAAKTAALDRLDGYLAQTDRQVIDALEAAVSVPGAVATYRTTVRTAIAATQAATTQDDLAAVTDPGVYT